MVLRSPTFTLTYCPNTHKEILSFGKDEREIKPFFFFTLFLLHVFVISLPNMLGAAHPTLYSLYSYENTVCSDFFPKQVCLSLLLITAHSLNLHFKEDNVLWEKYAMHSYLDIFTTADHIEEPVPPIHTDLVFL